MLNAIQCLARLSGLLLLLLVVVVLNGQAAEVD
jgi:hypothetical protein